MSQKRESRPWEAHGDGGFQYFEFHAPKREQILNQCRSLNIKPSKANLFISDLETAISVYRSDRRLADSNKPASIRQNLIVASATARKLIEQVETLDSNSQELLHETMHDCKDAEQDMQAMIDHLLRINCTLDGALALAKEYPLGGRLPDAARFCLAVSVAEIVSSHLDTRVTSTQDGPYVSLLELTLEAATNHSVTAAHGLAARVIEFRTFSESRSTKEFI